MSKIHSLTALRVTPTTLNMSNGRILRVFAVSIRRCHLRVSVAEQNGYIYEIKMSRLVSYFLQVDFELFQT